MKKRTQLSAILLALILATSSLSACKAQDSATLNAHASQKTVTENENSTQDTSDYISDIVSDAEESTDIEFSENVSDEESSEAEVEKVYTKADVDGNGKITADDYILLKRAIFGMANFNDEQIVAGDLNNNGKLDPTDYICLKRVYFGTANLEDILNGKPVEDESSEDVSEETSSEIVEESQPIESMPAEESSTPKDEPSESAPAESEIESSEIESSEPSIESSETESSEEPVESSEAVSSEPIEESSDTESSKPTESETNESKYNVNAAENLELTEERIVYYINQYRLSEGKCEMTITFGKSRAFARGRSVQLTKNFAHDYDDRMSLANELEYGVYEPEREEFYYDREKGEVVYTGNMTPAHYKPYGGEAIGALINAAGTADQIASAFVDALYESKAHWEYIGHEDNNYIAIGVQTDGYGYWTCCYLSLDAESAELYD